MEDIDKEISEMKISLNARARIVAEGFLKNVSVIVIFYIEKVNNDYVCLRSFKRIQCVTDLNKF